MTPRRLLQHEDLMSTFRRVHFIGIGGVGMSGIAEVLHNLGYAVSGSDKANSATAQRLAGLGIEVRIGHEAAHVGDADVVVTSSAIRADNPELVAAREARIPVIPRAEMLGELMRFRRGVAIAGTHGKTTTTSLVASVLAEANYDPTFVIGGQLNAAGANARLGTGQYLVAEADESDGSFLLLSPVIAAITNIDADHLENYHGDFAEVKKAFSAFLHRLPFYGLAVLCVDDPEVAELARDTSRRIMTYGIERADADVRAVNVTQRGFTMHFDLLLPGRAEALPVQLNLPGRHNVLNALAAASLALGAGASLDAIRDGLEAARSVAGRLVTHRLANGATLIDDSYNANPGSLNAAIDTLAAAGGSNWLVLGDMRELGVDAEALHAEAGRRAKAAGIARLFTLGPLSAAAARAFGEGAAHFETHDALADALRDALTADVRVLVKGSRGSAMDKVVRALLPPTGDAIHAA